MNDHETRIMFSSSRSDWETPEWLLRRIEREFGEIGLDVAAGCDNNVASKFYSTDNDAMDPKKSWKSELGISFCNPPYGRKSTPAWICRAFKECTDNAADIVCVVPARTETTWFHEVCAQGDIYLLKGRVTFCLGGEPVAPAPFPTAVIRFHHIDPMVPKVGTVRFVDWRDK